VGDGLLAIDIFSGAHGGDRDRYVPVVGCANHNGIDIFTIEDLAVIQVIARVRRGVLGFGLQPPGFVNVAAGDDFVLFGEFQLAQEILAASAGADGADAYAVIGAQDLAVRRGGGQCSSDELPAVWSI